MLKAEGERGAVCGRVKIARIGIDLSIGAFRLNLGGGYPIDRSCNVDMTRWRELFIDYQDGKIEICVDGKSLIRSSVFQDTIWERSYFGSDAEHEGILHLSSVCHKMDNPSDHSHSYEWQSGSSEYPNQYEIDRWLELDHNSNSSPNYGYSSWVQLAAGKIFVADYTNEAPPAGKACLKGYFLGAEELNL